MVGKVLGYFLNKCWNHETLKTLYTIHHELMLLMWCLEKLFSAVQIHSDFKMWSIKIYKNLLKEALRDKLMWWDWNMEVWIYMMCMWLWIRMSPPNVWVQNGSAGRPDSGRHAAGGSCRLWSCRFAVQHESNIKPGIKHIKIKAAVEFVISLHIVINWVVDMVCRRSHISKGFSHAFHLRAFTRVEGWENQFQLRTGFKLSDPSEIINPFIDVFWQQWRHTVPRRMGRNVRSAASSARERCWLSYL